VIDVLARPERLEDAVREAERQHVLHGLLAEVVVDAEDLVLAEVPEDFLVQALRRRKVEARTASPRSRATNRRLRGARRSRG
jgi:hypothetical protein